MVLLWLATGHKLCTFCRASGLRPVRLPLNFAWPACNSDLLGLAVTGFFLIDQVSVADMVYFCLSLYDATVVLWLTQRCSIEKYRPGMTWYIWGFEKWRRRVWCSRVQVWGDERQRAGLVLEIPQQWVTPHGQLRHADHEQDKTVLALTRRTRNWYLISLTGTVCGKFGWPWTSEKKSSFWKCVDPRVRKKKPSKWTSCSSQQRTPDDDDLL